MAAAAKAVLRLIRILISLFDGALKDSAETAVKIILIVFAGFILLLMLVIMPVVSHERIPVTATKQQALWYYSAAKNVSAMTQSPCDSGVTVDWEDVIAIDAVRFDQDFRHGSYKKAYKLARMFIVANGSCTYCTGSGKNRECETYTTYRLRTIDEVMTKLKMSEDDKEKVMKYRQISFSFLIGFNSGEQGQTYGPYEGLYSGELFWPVMASHSISSPYGWRVHPLKKKRTFHYGIDIPAPMGSIIYAAADGRITSTPYTSVGGNELRIDHGRNKAGKRMTTRYLHLSSYIKKAGDTVKKGEPIAKMGSTGWSTGSHLHFEVLLDGANQKPDKYFVVREEADEDDDDDTGKIPDEAVNNNSRR